MFTSFFLRLQDLMTNKHIFAQSALSLYQPRASEQVCASDAHIKGVLRTHLHQYWKRKQVGKEREGDTIRQMRSDCIRNRKIFHEKNFPDSSLS